MSGEDENTSQDIEGVLGEIDDVQNLCHEFKLQEKIKERKMREEIEIVKKKNV